MSRLHGCEKAALCADTSKTRRKHIPVGSAKTSMFSKVLNASTLGLLSLRFDCIRDNDKHKKN
ncbi:hypothetical protein L2737_21330 [Shewanella electrodiphila]|uniref:Uncharacterized protein n=1 Tax=Shewanella electrodiphila TaxID=934143 RepID=A0ABT0KVG5_9GAMM|nr:hypothetical protein [Shewanella electrodiphila]MCL1047848.1 hypothetical protein [Shewanella electrodiphila]